ncbi:unnamed protein product, partial [Symbiodinium microadriaticum]
YPSQPEKVSPLACKPLQLYADEWWRADEGMDSTLDVPLTYHLLEIEIVPCVWEHRKRRVQAEISKAMKLNLQQGPGGCKSSGVEAERDEDLKGLADGLPDLHDLAQ